MKTRLTILLMALLSAGCWQLRADETITVTANNGDISENLDLKAVATVFGESKDLETFEKAINDPENRISNLDLNGDGKVDYLRVVEVVENDTHLVLLQAVLAQDIFQDVASIMVEKDPDTQAVSVQVVGDEYIYGTNYVIEPVYIYRPVIYDWFWGPTWYCWYSPFYWGYYPTYWYAYDRWYCHDYWHHIHNFHYYHATCSFHYRPEPPRRYTDMHARQTRQDYAKSHPEQSFSRRQQDTGRQATNARDLQPSRSNTSVAEANGREQQMRGSASTASQGRTTETLNTGRNAKMRSDAASQVQGTTRISQSANSTSRQQNTTSARTSVGRTSVGGASAQGDDKIKSSSKGAGTVQVTRETSRQSAQASSSNLQSSSQSRTQSGSRTNTYTSGTKNTSGARSTSATIRRTGGSTSSGTVRQSGNSTSVTRQSGTTSTVRQSGTSTTRQGTSTGSTNIGTSSRGTTPRSTGVSSGSSTSRSSGSGSIGAGGRSSGSAGGSSGGRSSGGGGRTSSSGRR